jgi:hypothetical protein
MSVLSPTRRGRRSHPPSRECCGRSRDHDVGPLGQLGGELLWRAIGDVDAELGHRPDDVRVDVGGGLGAGGIGLMAAGGGVLEQGVAHLGAPRVVQADEQDAGHRSPRTSW